MPSTGVGEALLGAAKALFMRRIERDPVFRERYEFEEDARIEPDLGDMDCPLPYSPDRLVSEPVDPGDPPF